MHHRFHILIWRSAWARLAVLSLLLVTGLVAGGLILVKPIHAAPLNNTTTITDCANDSQLQSAVKNATSGETIAFGCSGDVSLSSTLDISTDLTLDGSGQSVTLDGQHRLRVLYVTGDVLLTLNALTIANGSGDSGGGLENDGGYLSITKSTFAGNSAVDVGGGLYSENAGTAVISDSTFADNSAGSGGAGVENDSGALTIANSTFADNSVDYSGGGIYDDNGSVSISDSTFAGNSAESGGGLYNYFGEVTITNSTFADNSASFGGGLLNEDNETIISGSIVANNTGHDCYGYNGGGNYDQGYNLSSDSSCGFTGTGSLQNTDPKLDPNGLQGNGGPTRTIALQSTSPAIDKVPTSACLDPDGGPLRIDQRGDARPDNGETSCDMGAYEYADPLDHDLALTNVPSDITVDATSPSGTVVSYTPPTVVDEDRPLPAVSCDPASGSTFAIGTTTVTCTATASGDANSPISASFTVTVKGAAAQLDDLIATVNSFHLSSSLQSSLDSKLNAALDALSAGQPPMACVDVAGFLGTVQVQSGKGLTASQANQLIAAAKQILAVLGCQPTGIQP